MPLLNIFCLVHFEKANVCEFVCGQSHAYHFLFIMKKTIFFQLLFKPFKEFHIMHRQQIEPAKRELNIKSILTTFMSVVVKKRLRIQFRLDKCFCISVFDKYFLHCTYECINTLNKKIYWYISFQKILHLKKV